MPRILMSEPRNRPRTAGSLSQYCRRAVSDVQGEEPQVVLVDPQDRQIGLAEKLDAHRNGGRLHRAVSVFIFNGRRELLLQQRADRKYHSQGLWSNTSCSHPRRSETAAHAAHRCLKEEMEIESDLQEAFSLIYRAEVGPGLTEFELDHVFVGLSESQPQISEREAQDWKWEPLRDLRQKVKQHSGQYTAWFRILLQDNRLYRAADKLLQRGPMEPVACVCEITDSDSPCS
jgi:isopentenyl-diphosphate Delta-isomerase